MKVKSIIGKTKEYGKLQGMIDNINTSLKTFDGIGREGATEEANMLTIRRSFLFLTIDDAGEKAININSEVTNLIKNDVISILNEQLSLLVAQQETLEV